jgi:hypothetical protein
MMLPSFLRYFPNNEELCIQVKSSLDIIALFMYVHSWTMCSYLFAVRGNSWTH